MTTPIRTPSERTDIEEQPRAGNAEAAAPAESASETRVDADATASANSTAAAAPASEDARSSGEHEKPEREKSRPFQSLVDLLHDLAIAVVVCVLLITYVVQAFKVQGTSMSPELLDGERILVNKFVYRFAEIERGDVVVFWYPEDPDLSFIKRVVGLPGETVEIQNGAVYVDGVLVDEPYVKVDNADRRSFAAQEIRPGHYFVLGDNRRGSNDSRSWGLVPKRYVYGKAFVKIWPPKDVGAVD